MDMSPTQKTPEAQEVMNEWIEQALTQKRNDLLALRNNVLKGRP